MISSIRAGRPARSGLLILLLALIAALSGTALAQSTVTVAHAQGETEVPLNPQTVMTFDLASLSTLDALGIEVAGVPEFIMPESLARYEGDEYLKIGSLFEPDYEAVAAAAPDLIIVANRSAAAYPLLSEIAPTIDLSVDWANFLPEQRRSAEILGQIFEKEDEVAALWAEIEADIEAVTAVTAEAGDSLIVMSSAGEVTAYGVGSRFGWLHEVLGFVPAVDDVEAATHGDAISFEFVLEANPDWLIVIDRDTAVGEESEAAAQVLDNELVARTTAWSTGQIIYLQPSNWYVVMGGLGAIQEMVDEVAEALGIMEEDAVESTGTPEDIGVTATPEA